MKRLCALGLCLFTFHTQAFADPPPVEVVGGVRLPGVAPSVTQEAGKPGPTPRAPVAEGAVPQFVDGAEGNVALTITPGATEIIRIATGYLNRIDTPFENPKVLSINPVEIQKEGASLYVATSTDKPVGIHVLSNDPEDSRSISLTLVPARIPPRSVTLKWPADSAPAGEAVSTAKARRWEESNSYEKTLVELVRTVARGQVPEGYSLGQRPPPIQCSLPGVKFVTGQRLSGTHLSIFVLRATNTSRTPLELYSHAGCDLPGVVLVAPWPQAYLDPGASTELYVVVANEGFDPRSNDRSRPSLLEH